MEPRKVSKAQLRDNGQVTPARSKMKVPPGLRRINELMDVCKSVDVCQDASPLPGGQMWPEDKQPLILFFMVGFKMENPSHFFESIFVVTGCGRGEEEEEEYQKRNVLGDQQARKPQRQPGDSVVTGWEPNHAARKFWVLPRLVPCRPGCVGESPGLPPAPWEVGLRVSSSASGPGRGAQREP